MKFKTIEPHELPQMGLCVVKLKDRKIWSHTGFTICVHMNGRFYDAMLFEQGTPDPDDDLTKYVVGFESLGEKL